ncbi:MAG: hypothetical protein NC090_05460 [Anaeroplasma bactoclasticum]|nr:hypothetical protein [Anaeroplasma bactoclasticum]
MSKAVDLFEVGKEYIVQGGDIKVKWANREEIRCMDLTFLQRHSTNLDIIQVDCLAEVNNRKVYPKDWVMGFMVLISHFIKLF